MELHKIKNYMNDFKNLVKEKSKEIEKSNINTTNNNNNNNMNSSNITNNMNKTNFTFRTHVDNLTHAKLAAEGSGYSYGLKLKELKLDSEKVINNHNCLY